MTRLFTIANPKTRKGEGRGYRTAILHLAPARLASTHTVCPASTPACRALCLNTAGRGRFGRIQAARIARTRAYWHNPDAFESALAAEIAALQRRSAQDGLTLAVRPNGTSDLPKLALGLAARLPGVQFYDYTKIPRPWLRQRPNYHLTFSRSEANEADCFAALAHDVNVAVVFAVRKGSPLPARWHGWPVLDGDLDDLRFLDPPGHVVGLRAKGRAKGKRSKFVVEV